MHILHQAPSQFGEKQSRWTQRSLLQVIQSWLRLHSLPGLSQLLKRLKIHWKRGRYHVHSPDPHYTAKLKDIWLLIHGTPEFWEQAVLIFEDEFTLYRHPGLAQAYEQSGCAQPLAELGYKGNYTWRIAAGLNLWTGQVTYHQARIMDITRLIGFYRKLCQTYPQVTIYLVQDNWSIHYHPDLLAALQPQTFPYGLHVPFNWHRTDRKVEHMQLPIHILPLPTYASWTNPIEKLWRLLRQEVLHLHRYADDWPALKQRVFGFLDQFHSCSPDLLRYIGLQDQKRLYRALFQA